MKNNIFNDELENIKLRNKYDILKYEYEDFAIIID